MMDELAEPARRRWLRRLAPWVITAAVLTAILVKYPVGRIVDEVQRGDAAGMVPVALAVMAGVWITATLADIIVLRGLVPALGFVRLARGKAGVSMLNALGMALNYGGFALWIQRALGCRGRPAVGAVLMITVGDLTAVAIVAIGSLLLGGDALPAAMRGRLWLVAPIVAAVGAALLVGPGAGGAGRPLFEVWRRLSRAQRAASVGVRLSTISVLIVGTWLAARVFGLPVPLSAWAAFLPVLLVIGALPVNVAGFGPVQAAWLVLFGPWASGPQILAFEFLWHLCLLLALVVRGAPFLRAAVADVARAPADQAGGQVAAAPPSTT